jgi:prophage regulatory protein
LPKPAAQPDRRITLFPSKALARYITGNSVETVVKKSFCSSNLPSGDDLCRRAPYVILHLDDLLVAVAGDRRVPTSRKNRISRTIAPLSDGNIEWPRCRSATSGGQWSADERIVLEAERRQLTGFSRGWWHRLEQQGLVPRRIKLGQRKVGWFYSEIRSWQRERAAMRDIGGGDARPA